MTARLAATALILMLGLAPALASAARVEPCTVEAGDECGDPYVAHLIEALRTEGAVATLVATGDLFESENNVGVALIADRNGAWKVRSYQCTSCADTEDRDWRAHVAGLKYTEKAIDRDLAMRIAAVMTSMLEQSTRIANPPGGLDGYTAVFADGDKTLVQPTPCCSPQSDVEQLMRELHRSGSRGSSTIDADKRASLSRQVRRLEKKLGTAAVQEKAHGND